jgi:hypothetical protein
MYLNLRTKDLKRGVEAVMMLACASARAKMAVRMPSYVGLEEWKYSGR